MFWVHFQSHHCTISLSLLEWFQKRPLGSFGSFTYTRGGSVNDIILELLCSLCYTSFDKSMMVIRDCRVGAEMAKCNITSAFTFSPSNQGNLELLGFSFQNQLYIYRVLPMDCSIMCRLWTLQLILSMGPKIVHWSKATAHFLHELFLLETLGSCQYETLLQGFSSCLAS